MIFPKRAKNADLRNRARCPGCSQMVKWSDDEDGDEVLATNCKFFCEKEDNKWIDDPLCYAKNFLVEVKLTKKPQNKKKKSYYKNKKKKGKSGKNNS